MTASIGSWASRAEESCVFVHHQSNRLRLRWWNLLAATPSNAWNFWPNKHLVLKFYEILTLWVNIPRHEENLTVRHFKILKWASALPIFLWVSKSENRLCVYNITISTFTSDSWVLTEYFFENLTVNLVCGFLIWQKNKKIFCLVLIYTTKFSKSSWIFHELLPKISIKIDVYSTQVSLLCIHFRRGIILSFFLKKFCLSWKTLFFLFIIATILTYTCFLTDL